MTTQPLNTAEETDTLLGKFIDRESALTEELQHVQDSQKTLDLILLGLGLKAAYPGARLLQVEIRQIGIIMGPAAVELTDSAGNVLAAGQDLAETRIHGWAVGELLADLAVRNNGSWIKDVSSEHDDHWGECDCGIYLDAVEPFAIDLDKASGLEVPELLD